MNEDPLFEDALFHQKRKKDKWRIVDRPAFSAYVADTHAHLQMLSNPALALARAAIHRVQFIETILDPAEDGSRTFEELGSWMVEAAHILHKFEEGCSEEGLAEARCSQKAVEADMRQENALGAWVGAKASLPQVRVAVGVHPHNAKDFTPEVRNILKERLHDRRVSALGEIGLDYHYDLSPRDVQQEVFREQIRLAHEAQLPVSLHMREAHDDGFAILQEEGFPQAGAILHCFNLDKYEVQRWVEAGCFIAFGGPLTFKKAEEVREAARVVPVSQLLTETDAPYMTPEPLRGIACEPAHTVFTAEQLCLARGICDPEEQAKFLAQIFENACTLLDRPATTWQKGEVRA